MTGAHSVAVQKHPQGGTFPPMTQRFDEDIMSTFGRHLKKAREAAGFATAKEFAEALGVEENRYRHWERGSAQPSLPTIVRITRLLKVELATLLPAAYRPQVNTADERKQA